MQAKRLSSQSGSDLDVLHVARRLGNRSAFFAKTIKVELDRLAKLSVNLIKRVSLLRPPACVDSAGRIGHTI
jgi:hypothetical protein